MACADNNNVPGLGIETNISVVADAIYQGLLDVISLSTDTQSVFKLHQSVFLSMTNVEDVEMNAQRIINERCSSSQLCGAF